MKSQTSRRRLARRLCGLGAAISAIMLILNTWMIITGPDPAGAATSSGGLVMTPTSGSSATEYTLGFASGATKSCPGDSATGGYFLSGFIVTSGTSIDNLVFNSIGPVGGVTVQDAGGTAVLNATLEVNTGNVLLLPGAFSFANNSPGDLAAGSYTLGLACTKGSGAGMVKTYWSTTIVVVADAANGGPAQFTWSASAAPTTTTTTGGGSTTTTTAGGSTTTTSADGSTTTTVDGGSTTTTTDGAAVSGADAFSGGSPSAASPVTTMGQLPFTGSSPLPMVFWAIALLVFGRMAMLLGKRPKVVGDDPPG